MKNIIFLSALFVFAGGQEFEDTLEGKCKSKLLSNVPTDWITMSDGCTQKMKEQVKEEFQAAMTYMAMGAHFAKDVVNRPGFSKMFFKAASEEREHGMKIMDYLIMRGGLLKDFSNIIGQPRPTNNKTAWKSGFEALSDALALESHVTRKITALVKACEDSPAIGIQLRNDYHLVDYLTGDFLEEQLKGQREIAGRVSTLGKMMDDHGPLGEFLYDKKLLEE
ncbi:ferritin subunit [Cimex lectularius]|uniref:Ferritin n=1 Tax=Cimex lectularius TaxID=79782 RepID=A0A8I6S3L6_CIMLE|nr:ferritin subunit [Cimex lectularius]